MTIGLTDRNDEELLALLQQAEVEALGVLYDRYHRPALSLAWRIVGQPEVAEEVVQEAFLALWRRASTYRPERGGVLGWLFGIVRNRSIDRLRRAPDPGVLVEVDEQIVDWRAPDLFVIAHRSIVSERVRAALEELPEPQREALNLMYYGGLTHQQVAERIGVPLGTVKGRVRLAMEKLRRTLADLGPDAVAAIPLRARPSPPYSSLHRVERGVGT